MKLSNTISLLFLSFFLMFSVNSFASAGAVAALSQDNSNKNDFASLHNSPVDIDINWLIVDRTYRTQDGKIVKCINGKLFEGMQCNFDKGTTIQNFIELNVGKQYRAVKIEPHFDRDANQVFLVIYYKLK